MIVLVGKTGSGKTTVYNELLKLGFHGVVTFTTRPMRDGEINGVTYNYISKEKFLSLKDQGFFIETTSYQVANGDTWYYGTPKQFVHDQSVVILNPYGLTAIKKSVGLDEKFLSIYLKANEEVLRERLDKRGDSEDEIERRLIADNNDFSSIESQVDFTLSNDSFGVTPESLAKIIKTIYEERW